MHSGHMKETTPITVPLVPRMAHDNDIIELTAW